MSAAAPPVDSPLSTGPTLASAEAEMPESVIVGVRVKPGPSSAVSALLVDEEARQLTLSPGVNEKTFRFDHTYGPSARQERIYEELGAPILRKALQGFNATIFAYGQTGSGKTHTMAGDGSEEGAGIVPRLGEELFFVVDRALEEEAERKFLLTASYLEIYNECLHDLLRPATRRAPSAGKRDGAPAAEALEIKEHPSLGVHVKGLIEMPVRDRKQLARLMADGNARRATGETQMNARSSRSHAIFSLRVTQQEPVEGTDGSERRERWSKINLVDLAGSERASKTGAEGSRLKEGIAINVSLSALGNVIIALANAAKSGKRTFVPFRNSKLTRVLQESLGGNSLTVMVATVSSEAQHVDETLSTLQYADRAKSIVLRAHKNEQISEVGKLKSEVDLLRRKLAEASGTAVSEEEKQQLSLYRSQVEEYEARLAVSYEEKAAVAAQLAAAHEAARAEVVEYHESRRAAHRFAGGPWLPLLWANNRAWGEGFLPSMASLQAELRATEDEAARCASMLAVMMQAVREGIASMDSSGAVGADTDAAGLDLGASIDLNRLLGDKSSGNLRGALGLNDASSLHALRLLRLRLEGLAAQIVKSDEIRARLSSLWGQVRASLEAERAMHIASSLGRVEMADVEEAAKDMTAVEEMVEVALGKLHGTGASAGTSDMLASRAVGECASAISASLIDVLGAEAQRLQAVGPADSAGDGGACERRVAEAQAAAKALIDLSGASGKGEKGAYDVLGDERAEGVGLGRRTVLATLQRGITAAERCISYRLVLRTSDGPADQLGMIANGAPVLSSSAGLAAKDAPAREALLRDQLASTRRQNEQLLAVVSCQATTIEQVTAGTGSATAREAAQQQQLASQTVRLAELEVELENLRQAAARAGVPTSGDDTAAASDAEMDDEDRLAIEREKCVQQELALRLADASLSATQSDAKALAAQASVAEARAAEVSGLADALRAELADAMQALETQAAELAQARAFEASWAELAAQVGCIDQEGQLMREQMEALTRELVETRDRERESREWLAEVKEMMASGKEDGLAMALCQNMQESRAKGEELARARREIDELRAELGKPPRGAAENARISSRGRANSEGALPRGGLLPSAGSAARGLLSTAKDAATRAKTPPQPPKAMLSERTRARLEAQGLDVEARGCAGSSVGGRGCGSTGRGTGRSTGTRWASAAPGPMEPASASSKSATTCMAGSGVSRAALRPIGGRRSVGE